MKTKSFFSLVFLFAIYACTDENTDSHITKEKSSVSSMDVNQIPNDIIALLYSDLLKDDLKDQAAALADSYYDGLLNRQDSHSDVLKLPTIAGRTSGANLPTRSVPNVGVVLAGNWFHVSGTTSANLEAIGWTDINFNVMNGTAPDAFSPTAPTSSQILGTINQQRRLEAFKLPTIQFAATDNLGSTYFSSSFGFSYRAYVQVDGWQPLPYKLSPSGIAGTEGQSRRMEAIKIYGPRFTNSSYTVTFNDAAPSTQAKPYIYYRVHQEVLGWSDWQSEDGQAGTPGLSRRIEAIQIRVYLIKI